MPTSRRFRTILTARLILEYREHILYLAQTPANGGGYTLPGGKIEGAEFAKEALVREVLEEVGVTVQKKSLRLALIVYKRLQSTTEIIFFFKSKKWEGELVVLEPDKFLKTEWLPIDESPKRLPAVIKAAFTAIEKEKTYMEYPSSKAKTAKNKGKKKVK
jgi:8-oxo-dGTP diphosphatase